MFKKTMKFDDLNGEEVSQTFYFNYNKKEIAELLEFSELEEKMALLSMPVEESGLTQVENNQQAYDIFQDLILGAYGEKGSDNVTFVKNERTREYWKSHVAFVDMIFEFLENPRLAAEFIEKCLPARMVAKAKEEIAAEHKGQLSSGTLSEMVQEAARRQEDPATRIEPGLEAAKEALQPGPEVVKAAQTISENTTKDVADLTEADILAMDDETFNKIDPQKLSKEQMMVAFRRKIKG